MSTQHNRRRFTAAPTAAAQPTDQPGDLLVPRELLTPELTAHLDAEQTFEPRLRTEVVAAWRAGYDYLYAIRDPHRRFGWSVASWHSPSHATYPSNDDGVVYPPGVQVERYTLTEIDDASDAADAPVHHVE